MASFAIAAIGKDRPGIVSAIAQVLFDTGCNVEDSQMSLLCGNFSVMLVLAAPDTLNAAALGSELSRVCAPLGLVTSVLDVNESNTRDEPTHILTVYGADKPGILLGVCGELAALEANVTNLNSRLVSSSSPVYVLMLELHLLDEHIVREALVAKGAALGVDMTLRAIDQDVL